MKTEIQKCLDGETFNTSDEEIQNLIHNARNLTKNYNLTPSTDSQKRNNILIELLGKWVIM